MTRRPNILLVALAACSGPGPVEETPRVEPADKRPAGAADCSDAPVVVFDGLPDAAGTRIALDGMPRASPVCTLLDCTDNRACCNRCGGNYFLSDEGRQVDLTGLPGCTGMDCNMVCDPFGKKPTLRYRFVGWYDHAQRRLEVDKFCVAN